jgi:hypothetical protein
MSRHDRKDHDGDNIPPDLSHFFSGPCCVPANGVWISPDLRLSCVQPFGSSSVVVVMGSLWHGAKEEKRCGSCGAYHYFIMP